MQGPPPATIPTPIASELLATGQRPNMILEVWIPGTGWVNICALGGKNYLKDISFTLGGARMTPNPIAADWSAVISNEDNVFHPDHPTSLWKTYFQAGRHVRIWIGGTYATGPKLWQRIIGRMDEPVYDESGFELTISGLDYMKTLSDMKFTKEIIGAGATPIDNYWGSIKIFDSVKTEGTLGPELYLENDAMEIGGGEAGVVASWTPVGGMTFVALLDGGGGSTWVGDAADNAAPPPWIGNPSVCTPVNVTKDKIYKFEFKYQVLAGTGDVNFRTYQTAGTCDSKLITPVDALWHQDHFYFPALETGPLGITIAFGDTVFHWKFDQFSIREVTTAVWNRYNMTGLGCTGIYHVELDEGAGFQAVWPGKQKGEGWYYDEVNEQFYFDKDKNIDVGAANLRIYYFTVQQPENVLADILVKAGIYNTRANALFAMGGPVTGVSIDRVWFDAGSTYIDAIKKICERCNRRFYFRYDGRPAFVTPPTAVSPPTFSFTHPRHIASPKLYQDMNEIRNKIVIEGEKRAELTGWEDNMPSELKGELKDATSIGLYGEHTLNIRNHLFQTQASITGMCVTLLAAYKDPKWYFDFNAPYNAVPLELGDTVRINVLLDRTLPPGTRHVYRRGLVRNMNISKYDLTFKCEKVED